ncbi:hypothetical protein [Streptomyces microflavus]
MRSGLRSLLVLCTVAASLIAATGTSHAVAPPTPSAPPTSAGSGALPSIPRTLAANDKGVCLRAHVSNIGWGNWFCQSGSYVGTVGQNKSIEALQISMYGAGDYCATAHIRDIGWGNQSCAQDGTDQIVTVGTTGYNRPMEAVAIYLTDPDTPWTLDGWSHVQNIGWKYHQPYSTGQITLGTIGKALNLEAVSLNVY